MGAPWPSARDFSEVLQNPQHAFRSPVLRGLIPSIDRFGMPVVATGNFAAVCKMIGGTDAFAVRFFTRNPGDRQVRYQHIHAFLEKNNVACIAEFEYLADECLIMGARYPIVQMEWINGERLDVFVERVLGKPDVLDALAKQWLDVIKSLEDLGIAHGDLQHGNVIVEAGSLRLVDLDGVFVPGMEKLGACEDGHRSYQHPLRSTTPFDENLDDFSALVIYLSLVALKEQPELWSRFHDDNLIFKRTDFSNPDSSPLLNILRARSGTVGSLSEALVAACKAAPDRIPSLVDLGLKPTSLPPWMRAPIDVPGGSPKTREAAPGVPIEQPRPAVSASSLTTLTRPTSSLPLPSSPATSGPTFPAPRQSSPVSLRKCLGHAILFGVMPGTIPFGVIGIPVLSAFFGRGGGAAAAVTWYCLMSTLGFWFALKAERERQNRPQQPIYTPAYSPTPSTRYSAPSTGRHPPSRSSPTQLGASAAVVASRIRAKYHRPQCRWARKISASNRMTFSSSAEARSKGPVSLLST
jgi:hypothetical protein